MSTMDVNSTIGDRLQKYMSAQFHDEMDPRIVDLARIGVGRSRENWVFDLVIDGEEADPLILRSDPDGGLVDTDRGTEFDLLRALESSPLPTPRARWLDADGTWLGRPSMIMQRAPGITDYRVLNGDRPLAVRHDLARQFCDLLAQVHQTDWRGLGIGQLLPDPGDRAALHELERWERILRADQLECYPELELAIDQLRESAPLSPRTVLVHADFKPGNILLVDDRIVALLDWELAHLGDPLEDLGWVTQPLRAVEHTIDGTWEAADLLEHYARATGSEVDQASLAWWVTFSTFKTAVMQVSGLRSFLEARSDQPYRPTRRVLSTLLAAITQGSN